MPDDPTIDKTVPLPKDVFDDPHAVEHANQTSDPLPGSPA